MFNTPSKIVFYSQRRKK